MEKYHGYHADPLPADLCSHFREWKKELSKEEIRIHVHQKPEAFILKQNPWNNCFLLGYAQHGAFDLSWDDGELRELPAGTFFLLRPRPVLRLKAREEKGEFILVFFRKRLLYQSLLPFLGQSREIFDFFIRCMEKDSPERCLRFLPPKNSRLHHALFALLIAGAEKSPDMEKLKESCLGTLLIFFSRLYRQKQDPKKYATDPGFILRYLSENCASASLESTAEHFSYNPSYLSRLIREQTGRTFSELLRDFRLEHACMLLRETELSIQQIAGLVGYNHMGNFYKQFKGKYGFTPRDLREKLMT